MFVWPLYVKRKIYYLIKETKLVTILTFENYGAGVTIPQVQMDWNIMLSISCAIRTFYYIKF